MTENLPAVTDKNFTSELFRKIQELALAGTEGITGLLASDRKDMILTSGRLFQSLINLEFLETLHNEWDDLRSKGRIKDDYQQTEQHHACLQEMLDFLDTDKPDKIRFEFMKKIFLSTATETAENRESVLPQQYMSIARQLRSGDVLLLSGLFDMYTKKLNEIEKDNQAEAWLKKVAANTPLAHVELVRIHEKRLMELELISQRSAGFRLIDPQNNRLTDLALKMYDFINGYDSLVRESET